MSEPVFPNGATMDDPLDVPIAVSGEAEPVQPSERLHLLDVLRGFALLGMLQQNDQKGGSLVLDNLVNFIADGSFYTMFSFLFGLGFAIQIIRAEDVKRPFIMRYLWRTLILLGIGSAHFIFSRGHPVLIHYSILAIVLLLVRRWQPKFILALAIVWLVLAMSPQIPQGQILTRVNPEVVETERLALQHRTATSQANPPAWCHMVPGLTDTYRREVCTRAAQVRDNLAYNVPTINWWIWGWTGIMTMFLLGLWVGRKRILQNVAEKTRFLGWVGSVGFVVGVVGNSLAVFKDFFATKGIALPATLDGWQVAYLLGNIGLALFYMCVVTLLYTHWGRATRFLSPLAYVGRMGLTNYLMQAVVLVSVLGYRGFDVMAGLGAWQNHLVINAFFAVQIVYSWWWFEHFRFGPVEWIWRSLTWLRPQPMRRTAREK